MWRLIRKKSDILLILLFVAAYNISVDTYCLRRYWSYNAGAFDFGIAVQTMWNTSRGDLLWESVNMGMPASRFWNGRWEIIFIPIGWMYRIISKPEFLLVLQTFIISLGILPVYALSKVVLGGTLSASLVSLSYIVNPVIHNPNLFDFHSVSLSITFLLFLFFYTHAKYDAKMICLFFLLALSCRADLAPLLAAYAVYHYVVHRKAKFAAVLFVIALGWLVLSRSTSSLREILGLPAITNINVYTERWEHLGGTNPWSVILNAMKAPSLLVSSVVNAENLKYLVKIFAPFAFLPLLAPLTTFVSLPSILINATSAWPPAHHIFHHYNAHVGAVLMIASIYAIDRGAKCFGGRAVQARMVLVGLLLLAATASAVTKSSFALLPDWRRGSHHEKLDRNIGDIDEEKSISAHFLILDHVAHRKQVYLFPDNVGSVDLVVYDLKLPYTRIMTHEMISHRKADPLNMQLKRLLNDPSYGVKAYEDGIMIFEKGRGRAEGIRKLMEPGEIDGYASRDLELKNGMSIEGVRWNGIVGADLDNLSFSVLCRTRSERPLTEPLQLILTDGKVSHRAWCRSMVSSITGAGESVPEGTRYVDEIFVRLPDDLKGHRLIKVFIEGRNGRYRVFDVIREEG
jgi:uncharacterized membrane protein